VVEQYGERMLGDVEKAVVEGERDSPRRKRVALEQVGERDHVDDAIPPASEVLHLSVKGVRANGELVPVVGDPVVEQDAERAGVLGRVPARMPGDRAGTRRAGLEGVERGGRDP
jgi:hypothetical protein